MQVEVPQILWHYDSRQIMSIDIYPNSNYLVTSSVFSDEDTGIRVSHFQHQNNFAQKLTSYSSGSSFVSKALSPTKLGGSRTIGTTSRVATLRQ